MHDLTNWGAGTKPGTPVCAVLNFEGMANYHMDNWKIFGIFIQYEPTVGYVHIEVNGEHKAIYEHHIGFFGHVVPAI